MKCEGMWHMVNSLNAFRVTSLPVDRGKMLSLQNANALKN